MTKILLSHKQLGQNELKIRAELHIFKMDQNPTYVAVQPLVTTLKGLTDVYSTALSNAADGGKENTKAKNRAKKELEDFITKLTKTIELQANELLEGDDEEFATGGGFVVQEASTKKNLTFLAKPTNLSAIDLLELAGGVKINWKKNEDTISCGIEYKEKADEPWKNGTFSTSNSALLTGLPSGKYITIRIYGIGRKGLKSDPTEAVTVLVS